VLVVCPVGMRVNAHHLQPHPSNQRCTHYSIKGQSCFELDRREHFQDLFDMVERWSGWRSGRNKTPADQDLPLDLFARKMITIEGFLNCKLSLERKSSLWVVGVFNFSFFFTPPCLLMLVFLIVQNVWLKE
jgi:hypothetical protein